MSGIGAQNRDAAEDRSTEMEREAFLEASRRAVEYLAQIRDRPVFPSPDAVRSVWRIAQARYRRLLIPRIDRRSRTHEFENQVICSCTCLTSYLDGQ